jgi:serine/threonine protein kinase
MSSDRNPDVFDAEKTRRAPYGAPPLPTEPVPEETSKDDPFDTGRTVLHDPSSSGPQSLLVDESTRAVDLPIGYVLDGRLVVTQKLGQGGMGAVYRVTDRETYAEYAVKVLCAELANNLQAVADLKHEVARAQPLVHQNLLNIKYFADAGPVKYVVMEYVDGETLDAFRLRAGRQGKLSQSDFLSVAEQVLAGLDFLHERGVVHLDVKPENVLVAKSAQVKIADYGIAKSLDEQVGRGGDRVPGGTLCYMAPEQIRGTVCDRRTDVYAAGVVFHLLLTGSFPFGDADRQAIVAWHLDDRHTISARVPSQWRGAIAKALAANPNDRWTSCSQFRQALQIAGIASDGICPTGERLAEMLKPYDECILSLCSGLSTEFQSVFYPVPAIWGTWEQAVEYIIGKPLTEASSEPDHVLEHVNLPMIAVHRNDDDISLQRSSQAGGTVGRIGYRARAFTFYAEDLSQILEQFEQRFPKSNGRQVAIQVPGRGAATVELTSIGENSTEYTLRVHEYHFTLKAVLA